MSTRRGLVLGAGGVLGFSWAVGALTALEQEHGFDARAVDYIVGTSAGSITAALLGCGVGVETMLRHQSGIPVETDALIEYDYESDGGGALPPMPGPGLGSVPLLIRSALHPFGVTRLAAMSAVLPRGRASLEPVRAIVSGIAGGSAWTDHPRAWVVAMDYATGRRTVFGRPGAPEAPLPDAVMASCAIPGWYAPVSIGGRRYVDGGACSSTSLDLLAGLGLDEIYVVAPMASFAPDQPWSVAARFERRFRQIVTRRLLRESEKVRAAGTDVIMLAPGPEDLTAIGANLMDPRRRERVLRISLRTSVEGLRDLAGGEQPNGDLSDAM
ncbi:MAG: patatin-like phospholipase family protein [Pseudonocardiales bacterium]